MTQEGDNACVRAFVWEVAMIERVAGVACMLLLPPCAAPVACQSPALPLGLLRQHPLPRSPEQSSVEHVGALQRTTAARPASTRPPAAQLVTCTSTS